MNLGEKQREFARLIGLFISHAYASGYQLTLGDAYRDPRVTYGHPKSVHRSRLAVDFNLFENRSGVWVYRIDTESWRPLGEWWEKQHELARWGGRFSDGNHLSLEHEGVK